MLNSLRQLLHFDVPAKVNIAADHAHRSEELFFKEDDAETLYDNSLGGSFFRAKHLNESLHSGVKSWELGRYRPGDQEEPEDDVHGLDQFKSKSLDSFYQLQLHPECVSSWDLKKQILRQHVQITEQHKDTLYALGQTSFSH
jgi:hypothetical protein